jgi:hypothetical protein
MCLKAAIFSFLSLSIEYLRPQQFFKYKLIATFKINLFDTHLHLHYRPPHINMVGRRSGLYRFGIQKDLPDGWEHISPSVAKNRYTGEVMPIEAVLAMYGRTRTVMGKEPQMMIQQPLYPQDFLFNDILFSTYNDPQQYLHYDASAYLFPQQHVPYDAFTCTFPQQYPPYIPTPFVAPVPANVPVTVPIPTPTRQQQQQATLHTLSTSNVDVIDVDEDTTISDFAEECRAEGLLPNGFDSSTSTSLDEEYIMTSDFSFTSEGEIQYAENSDSSPPAAFDLKDMEAELARQIPEFLVPYNEVVHELPVIEYGGSTWVQASGI